MGGDHEERLVAAVDGAILAVQQQRSAVILLSAKPERAEWSTAGSSQARFAAARWPDKESAISQENYEYHQWH